MKVKLPKGAQAQNGQTVIVIKEKRRGSCGGGCLLALLLSAGLCWMMYSCFNDQQRVAAELRQHEASLTPEERAARAIAKPDASAVDYQLRGSLRRYLHDPSSYQPGETRVGDHPKGWAYFHEYRAKNALGAVIKSNCALLCATNTGKRVWTFYDVDDVPQLVNELQPK